MAPTAGIRSSRSLQHHHATTCASCGSSVQAPFDEEIVVPVDLTVPEELAPEAGRRRRARSRSCLLHTSAARVVAIDLAAVGTPVVAGRVACGEARLHDTAASAYAVANNELRIIEGRIDKAETDDA